MADACEARGMPVIETIEECNLAAEALKLSDTSASKGIDSPRWRPYGCVWNRGRLQLNLNKDARQRGTAPDNTVKQICGPGATAAPTASPSASPTERGVWEGPDDSNYYDYCTRECEEHGSSWSCSGFGCKGLGPSA